MANATAYSSLDMFATGTTWLGTATSATSSYIRLESYPHRQDFYGSFTYDQTGLTGGTITSSYTYEAGAQYWSVTGISLNALTYNAYVTSNNIQGLYNYVLGNNDTFTGSSGNDGLRTFAGNDIINAGDGNDVLEGGAGFDTLNGGTGTDTAIFSGTRAQYTLSASGTGWTLSGPDGVDTLSSIEFAQFSDQTLSLGNFAPTGAISVSGTPSQNQTLSASSTLADLNGLGTLAYQWKADGIAIGGATASTFVVTEAQVGKTITVTASYTDGHGTAESVTSAATNAIANINDIPTGTVGAGGTATQGQTLTASNTLADPDGMGTISYQWQAGGSNISGATGSTFTLTEAHVGKIITVTATYTDGHGTAESITSAATGFVANINDTPTGTVGAGGTATQGQTLTASNTLADPDGMGTISYQWQSSSDGSTWSNLSSGVTLGLTEAQVGKQIKVIASYTDGHGTVEAVPSAATGSVANINDAPTGTVGVGGTATQGEILTASNSLADSDGVGAISYQWKANGTSIGGATTSTLLLTQAQVGKTIAVTVSYTDGHGTVESVTSAATSAVANINDAPTVSNVGNRTAGLNEPLSLNLGMLFSDPDGDALSFAASGLPAGLSIDTATGILSGTTPNALGVHHLTVTGTDPGAAFVSVNFDLNLIAGHTVSANVVTRSGLALPGVTAHEVLGATPSSVDLGSGAHYSNTLPDGSLALSLSRGTTDYLVNGVTKPVTAADALDALKLSVGLASSKGSSWKELIAADMNHDGRVTAADALEILKASVGINTIQPSWVFVPNDAVGLAGMTKNTVSHTDSWNLTSITAPTANTFTGILVGDVNNSWLIPA